ncbi:MAG: hypothetical protein U5R31_13855 [Acidimicrobiia bacterium]|nr:hypothetical protein [Acidimicrobiia bacterium]
MEFLLVLSVVMLVVTAAALGSVAWGLWWLRRQNRVGGRGGPEAPLSWLWSPGTAARLHRRLRAAVATAAAVPRDPRAPDTSRGALAGEVEHQARELDAWLLWAARAPVQVRRAHHRAVAAHVGTVESLAVRLSRLEPSPTSTRAIDETGTRLTELADEVARLEAATDEIAHLDRLLSGEMPEPPGGGPPRRLPTPDHPPHRDPA